MTDAGLARLTGASGHAVTVEVKVSDEIMPGVISLPHGWGHDLPGSAWRSPPGGRAPT